MTIVKNVIGKIKSETLALCQKVGAAKVAPSSSQIQLGLFGLGVALLSLGLSHESFAQITIIGGGTADIGDHEIAYNDTQIAGAVTAILTYIEGAFGALVMVAAGIAAILSSAFGQYRAALGCLVVAVGAFILRSIMSTFFNTESFDSGAQ